MFAEDIYEKAQAAYYDHILLIDSDGLESMTDYSSYFAVHGFNVAWYKEDLSFRIRYSQSMLPGNEKWAVIAPKNVYIPYDIRRRFYTCDVKLSSLYPLLNSSVLKESSINYDLLSEAYKHCYDDLTSQEGTRRFIEKSVFSRENYSHFLHIKLELLKEAVTHAVHYNDWFRIAELKAYIDVNSVQFNLDYDTSFVNDLFGAFILTRYGQLSSALDKESPVLVSRIMEYVHDRSKKLALIVMDGMSQFDWEIIQESFSGIKYQKSNAYAMIPTTTSVSRQCLLSNKYPKQLLSPWTQSQEKKEFIECAQHLGYLPNQISYSRGYDASFSSSVSCAAIIINDVDDMVHGQKQGRIGMLNDISVLAKEGKLRLLTDCLIKQGFDVYITADHGNTQCTGMGKLVGTGVDVETKSRRMIVLKDFADKQGMIEKYDLMEYPGYYLDKSYDYLICKSDRSFDASGSIVMNHGGITIDEVIVPFISIKADENNG